MSKQEIGHTLNCSYLGAASKQGKGGGLAGARRTHLAPLSGSLILSKSGALPWQHLMQ